jgi:hypothetical protein
MNKFLKSLNGWQRLGVFISAMMAILCFLIGYEDKRAVVNHQVPEKFQNLKDQQFIDEVYWGAISNENELKYCIDGTGSVEPSPYDFRPASERTGPVSTAYVSCDIKIERRIVVGLSYAFIPFVIIFGFGYVFAWIIAGFRQGRKTTLQKEQDAER